MWTSFSTEFIVQSGCRFGIGPNVVVTSAIICTIQNATFYCKAVMLKLELAVRLMDVRNLFVIDVGKFGNSLYVHLV